MQEDQIRCTYYDTCPQYCAHKWAHKPKHCYGEPCMCQGDNCPATQTFSPKPDECEWDENCHSPVTHMIMTCHGHYRSCELHAQKAVGEPDVQYIVKRSTSFKNKTGGT